MPTFSTTCVHPPPPAYAKTILTPALTEKTEGINFQFLLIQYGFQRIIVCFFGCETFVFCTFFVTPPEHTLRRSRFGVEPTEPKTHPNKEKLSPNRSVSRCGPHTFCANSRPVAGISLLNRRNVLEKNAKIPAI